MDGTRVRPAPESPPAKEMMDENGPAPQPIARTETRVVGEEYLDPSRISGVGTMHPGDRFTLELLDTGGQLATLLLRKGRLIGRLPFETVLDDPATWEASSVWFYPSEKPLEVRLRPHSILDCGCVEHHMTGHVIRRCGTHEDELLATLKDATCEHGRSVLEVCGRCDFDGDRRRAEERRLIDEATR